MDRKLRVKVRSLRGLTLIELIAVISIMTLLSAIALPTLRSVMSQRKTSQASILVKNMLEAARARAIANGRPVAVVLERLSSRAARDPNDATRLLSITASSTDFPANYETYNTCIRLSLAESPKPAEFEGISLVWRHRQDPTVSANPQPYESYVEITSASMDPRLVQLIKPGASIEFPQFVSSYRSLLVEQVISTTPLQVRLNTQFRTGTGPAINTSEFFASLQNQVNKTAISRRAIYSPITIQDTVVPTTMIVTPLPEPVASMVVDMPKGTCVDLSLSGYASDTRWTSPIASVQRIINLRDTRRQFASDWIVPNNDPAGQPNNDPSPASLRPVYIVFGPNGVLESVLMNGISGTTGLPQLNKYDAHEDVFLFVGRTDQIIRTTGFASTLDNLLISPDVLERERIKANINDNTCEWVKISPRSGTISVATAARYNTSGVTATTSMGQVLYESRMLSFTDEATAQ